MLLYNWKVVKLSNKPCLFKINAFFSVQQFPNFPTVVQLFLVVNLKHNADIAIIEFKEKN